MFEWNGTVNQYTLYTQCTVRIKLPKRTWETISTVANIQVPVGHSQLIDLLHIQVMVSDDPHYNLFFNECMHACTCLLP